MSAINVPIQIPSELNVPEPDDGGVDKEDSKSIRSKSASSSVENSSQSVEQLVSKALPKHRLRGDAKSQSMYNFSTAAIRAAEDQIESANVENQSGAPTITLTCASAKYQKNGERKSTASLNGKTEASLLGEDIGKLHPISNSINDMKLSANRRRVGSLPTSDPLDDDEFDEIDSRRAQGSQLRIRSSIISLFGRMGKMRRTSNNSQTSVQDDSNDHPPPLRALPQIVGAKILRAFSYVGKHRRTNCELYMPISDLRAIFPMHSFKTNSNRLNILLLILLFLYFQLL